VLKSRALVLALLLALMAPALAQAKVYWFNKGVKYHIGDGRAGTSEDPLFLDAFPVVGPKWVQAFTVDRPDTVKVSIQSIWGVDDCAYCKDMIFIDDHKMGRLFEENNHHSFDTPNPLSMKVVPGHVYVLKIESEGLPGPIDDFAIEGVSVESDAEITPQGPPQIVKTIPKFHPEVVEGPCEGTAAVTDWLPPTARSRGMLGWSPSLNPVLKRMGAQVGDGQFVRFFLRVERAAQGRAVEQFFEVLLGDPGTGWVLDFAPGETKPFQGNVKVQGVYRSDHFTVNDWKDKGWNEIKLARCPDGRSVLWINGRDTGVSQSNISAATFRLRSGGLKAEVAGSPY
jgi:hypothetical protein